ncbi:MAG TPA: hypothetical protein VH593_14340 [Ktedonobacteraceae bacterium]|jgi:hypothetical protein
MKVLSIQQPWSWLIVNGIKDIENREWIATYKGLLLIHAGKNVDRNAFYGDGRFGAYPFGLEDTSFLSTMPLREGYELGGIVGYATLQGVVSHSESPWFRGSYGFVLTDAHPVPLIPLRGQLGLFDAPPEVEAQIKEIMVQGG